VNRIRATRLGRRLVALLAALVLAGAAAAYYAATGAGSGTASGGSALPVSAAAAAPVAGLYPGGSAELALTFDNPNPSQVHVGSVALDTSHGTGGFSVDGAHSASCTTPALSFAAQSNGGQGWDVPPKTGSTDGTLTVHLSGAVSMGPAASNGCQGASFTVYLEAGS